MQAGLKGFNKIPAQKIFKTPTLTGFSCDAYFFLQLNKHTIGELPAQVSQQHPYKNFQVNIFKDSLKMLLCLFKVRANYRVGYYG